MIIRRGKIDDLPAIQAFYAEVVPTIEFETTSWVPGVYPSVETAKKAIYLKTMYVAVIGEKVVGSAILNHEADEGYTKIPWENPQLAAEEVLIIHTLMISPSYRKQGIALQLLNFAIELAKDQKCQAIRLDTFAANQPARQLYEKLGFRCCGTGELPSWKGEGTDTCVFFEQNLANK